MELTCTKCGGDGPFPLKGNICIACKKAYKEEWDRQNKESVKAYNHERYLNDPEGSAERTNQWREAHPEEKKQHNRKAASKRYHAGPGRTYHQDWQRNNKERVSGYQQTWRNKKDGQETE